MLKQAVGYAYPWDFAGDPDAADRAASLGLDTVAVAANYHVTRAATPLHPLHRIVHEERAACYVPLRDDAWRGHRLVPATPTSDRDSGSFVDARNQLSAQGLRVYAWIVLCHNSTLGEDNNDLVVRNAYDDLYPYALCPSKEEVRQYCQTLVAEIIASAPLDGVVLEACGPMGFDHGGHHDKTQLAGWNATQRKMLSLCFCATCRERYAAEGLDSDRLAGRIRAGVEVVGKDAPASVGEWLGDDDADAVAVVRTGLAADLRALLINTCRSNSQRVETVVHGSSDRWSTGSFSTLQPRLGEGVDTVVGNCWDVTEGEERIRELRTLASPSTDVGGYLRLNSDWEPGEATDRRLESYLAAGASELHLYNLGLLGEEGLSRLAGVVRTARSLSTATGQSGGN